MYPGPSARLYGSLITGTLENGKHKIATFPTHEKGACALFDLLARGYLDRTLSDAITKWCGANYADQYLDGIEKRTGLSRGTWIDREWLENSEGAVPLAIAMARHEAGQDYPLTETQWLAAHATAMVLVTWPKAAKAPAPKPEPSAWTPDNATPSPRPEARASEGAARSRKYSLADLWSRAQAALGVGVAGTVTAEQAGVLPAAVKLVKQFATDHAVLLIIAGVVCGLAVSETIKQLTNEDIADGRYVPKGDA